MKKQSVKKVNAVPNIKDKPKGMKRFTFFRSLGYCGRCGKNPSTKSLCSECASYNAEWLKNKREMKAAEKLVIGSKKSKKTVLVGPKGEVFVEDTPKPVKKSKKGTIAKMVEEVLD